MKVRKAAVAGRFYEGDPSVLRGDVEAYLSGAEVKPAPERVAAVVAPHAGHFYSGACAGFAFARSKGKQPQRIVILGRSHRAYFGGASIYAEGGFETPLGVSPVDAAFASALVDAMSSTSTEPHLAEHALEVLLPFVQVCFGETPIVPVLFGDEPGAWHARFGQYLAETMGEEDLLLASTDLSHFLTEREANAIDRRSLDTMMQQDCTTFCEGLHAETCSMCGGPAVVAAMAYAVARGARDWRLLDYRTSAAASHDTSRVVGYAAVSMEKAA